jgi:hypothetical protein
MDGLSHLTYQVGRRTIALTYNQCRTDGCKKCCVKFDKKNRDTFDAIMLDVFEWDRLTTQEACEVAQHLNEGTPMNMGEKLKLLCGRETPRARMLKKFFESDEYQKVCIEDREKERKILACFIRRVVSPDVSFGEHLTSNFGPLDNFYRSDEPVRDEHWQQVESVLSKTASLLDGRKKDFRNLMICLVGFLRADVDVEGALADATDLSVEDVLQRH